jgi:hypothetical protein
MVDTGKQDAAAILKHARLQKAIPTEIIDTTSKRHNALKSFRMNHKTLQVLHCVLTHASETGRPLLIVNTYIERD